VRSKADEMAILI